MSSTVNRPGSVTAAVVLTAIAGIFDVIAGVLLLVFAGNRAILSELGDDASPGAIRLIGIVTILVGLVVLLIAAGLSRGSNVSRVIVAVVMVIRIVVYFWAIIAIGSHALTEGILGIAWAVFIIALLYNKSAADFFGGQGRVTT